MAEYLAVFLSIGARNQVGGWAFAVADAVRHREADGPLPTQARRNAVYWRCGHRLSAGDAAISGLSSVAPDEARAGVDMAKRLSTISVNCLPALIAEIDARRYRPTSEKCAEITARYRARERYSRQGSSATRASNMINEYLIGVLWQTRKYRLPNRGISWQD